MILLWQLLLLVSFTILWSHECVTAFKIRHPVDESVEPHEDYFPLTTTTPYPIDKYNAGGILSFKTNKGNVQQYITNLDSKRERSLTWKTYFPQILAGVLLSLAIIVFLVWYNITQRGIQNLPVQGVDPEKYRLRHGRYYYNGRIVTHINSRRDSEFISDFSGLGLVQPKSSVPICSKPACVCASDAGRKPKGKRKWNYKEDNEAYGPAKPV